MSNRLRGFSLVLMGLYLLVVGGRAIRKGGTWIRGVDS